MTQVSKEFRAGWEATCEHLDGVANYESEHFEKHLQDAWDKYYKENPSNFAEDFANVTGRIRRVCAKYDLPLPALILHPYWRTCMMANLYRNSQLEIDTLGNLKYMGVRLHFGDIRSGNVII